MAVKAWWIRGDKKDIDRLTAKDMSRSKEDSRDAVPDGIAAGNLPPELRAERRSEWAQLHS
jgi:hypothetical protein